MTQFGLKGSRWNVGHIAPNTPGTKRNNDPEDFGWNLMAIDVTDNILLGNQTVSKDILDYYSRGTPNYKPGMSTPVPVIREISNNLTNIKPVKLKSKPKSSKHSKPKSNHPNHSKK